MLSPVVGATDYRAAADSLTESLLANPPAPLPSVPMMTAIGSKTEEHYLTAMRRLAPELIRQGQIGRDASVLDIGCGCGRMASAFSQYLSDDARYLGFDLWEDGIRWCQENITPVRPNFEFRTIKASDDYYFLKGDGSPNQFDLGFIPSASFDCVFAISVFTHLKLHDARQYFEMIARVLKPGGRACLTFFMMDEQVRAYLRESRPHDTFSRTEAGLWHGYGDKEYGFFAGFEEPLLLELFGESGLTVLERSLGAWANRRGARTHQDWYLVQRPAA